MWFAEDERLLDDIVERLCSMVADLKTLIPMPTQKRAKRGSKHGHEISQSLVYMGEHPRGHFEGHLRDKGLDQPRIQSPPPPRNNNNNNNSNEVTLEDFLRM